LTVVVVTLSLSASFPLFADENPRNDPGAREARTRRYVMATQHPLSAAEQAQLKAAGVAFEHPLTNGRYLVKIAGDTAAIETDPRVVTLAPLTAAQKVYRSAQRELARPKAAARVTVLFGDDVTLEQARSAITAAGAEVESPGAGFEILRALVVRGPATAVKALSDDNRVLAVAGPPLHRAADNAVAAQMSSVTPLFSAPYNLSGAGVQLSLFELGTVETTHVEFGGRVTSDFPAGSSADSHATHVAGTIAASGVNPAAKGMAPAAKVRVFDATVDAAELFDTKLAGLTALGSVADNNSWGFQLGWQPTTSLWTWFGNLEYLSGYDAFWTAGFDKIAHVAPTLYVHSNGNDALNGEPDLAGLYSGHHHVDDETGNPIEDETFCYSRNGTGTDCPVPACNAGPAHCEITPHPTYGAYTTSGLTSAAKNVVAVGSLLAPSKEISTFSSRGPTRDGRIKPDVVAKGQVTYSTIPGNLYGNKSGTSMSSPVVTGVTGLLVEQWRKSNGGASPQPQMLKTLLIAGADDIAIGNGGTEGPDYTYGFGLVDAKASVDLILADAAVKGSRIRTGSLAQGQSTETQLNVATAQNVRVVLAWSDPEVFTFDPATDLADKTLVNDLDVKVIDPSGATVFPYVLDPAHPSVAATRGVNTVDNVEEIEIKNAAAGAYRVIVNASRIGDTASTTQNYVLIANAALADAAPSCTDAYEPNESTAAAYGDVATGTTVTAKTCSATDVDFFRFSPNQAGTVRVRVTASDTPLTVTEYNAAGNATGNTINVAAGATTDLTFTISGAQREFISIKANGAVGSTAAYTATFTYPFATPARRRAAGH
jgi:hypothetical protein